MNIVNSERKVHNKSRKRPTEVEGRTSVFIFVPAGFDPAEYLPAELHKYGDYARYILHRIIYGSVFERKKKGYVPINAEIMRGYFPKKTLWPKIRDALIGRVIHADGDIIRGKKSCGYMLAGLLAQAPVERVPVQAKPLAKKILAWRRRSEVQLTHPCHRHLRRQLRWLDLDYEGALAVCGRMRSRKRRIHETSLKLLNAKEISFKPCKYGRVHTNVTRLKSCFRKFLSYKSERLVSMDIKNSQPLFLGLVLLNYYKNGGSLESFRTFSIKQDVRDIDESLLASLEGVKEEEEGSGEQHTTNMLSTFGTAPAINGIPEDFLHYLDLCQNGQFYEYLMKELSIPDNERERKRFKKKTFRVFYGKTNHDLPLAGVIAKLFPSVYKAINELKKKDYKALAHMLQRQESVFVIETVVGRCIDEIPQAFLTTIHDSVVTTPEYAKKVHEIMMDEFAKLGLKPKIKEEVFQ